MFLNSLGNIFASRKQILFPQQCFHGWANRETFEETSQITNVSATMFPSLPTWGLTYFNLVVTMLTSYLQFRCLSGQDNFQPEIKAHLSI